MFSSAALCFPNKSSSRMQNRPFIFKILYLCGGANLFGFDPARDKSKRRTLLALTLPPPNARPLIILPFLLISFLDFQRKNKKLHWKKWLCQQEVQTMHSDHTNQNFWLSWLNFWLSWYFITRMFDKFNHKYLICTFWIYQISKIYATRFFSRNNE